MTDHDRIVAKRHRIRDLELYDVSGDELDKIESLAANVGSDLQFATFWLPIGITALLTLLVVPIGSQRVYISYLCVVLVSFGLGVNFLVRWFRSRGELTRCVNKIRERQVGPVGEEGRELKPSELAALPAVAPPKEEPQ